MNQEIALYEKLTNPVEAIERLGTMFAKSGMFGCERSEQGQLLAMICLAERKSPVEIMRTYDIIGGKLRKKALAALAEFRQRGGKHRWIKTGDEPAAKEDEREAVGEFEFEGSKITVHFSIAQARKAGAIFKVGSNWIKTPGNMLRARVASNAVAMLAPEIFAGEGEDAEPVPVAPLKLGANAPEAMPGTPGVTSPEAGKIADTIEAVLVADLALASRTAPPEDEDTLAAQGLAPSKPISSVTQTQPAASQSAGAAGEPTVPPSPPVSAPSPAAAALQPAPTGNGGTVLSDDMVTKIENAIGEHAVAAGKWLLAEGWLKPGQSLANLSETRAKRIVLQRDSFIRALTGGAK